MKKLLWLSFIVGLLQAGIASAVPVIWTLSATFEDGHIATGQFTYDADLDVFTDSEFLFGRPGFPQGVFSDSRALAGDGTQLSIYEVGTDYSQGFPVGYFAGLELEFSEALTNAGGTVNLASGLEFYNEQNPGFEDGENCYYVPFCRVNELALISGSVTAVPIPAAVWLFGSALFGLGWFRRAS